MFLLSMFFLEQSFYETKNGKSSSFWHEFSYKNFYEKLFKITNDKMQLVKLVVPHNYKTEKKNYLTMCSLV